MHRKPTVFYSSSTDPYVNLSLEDQLFRCTDLPALFLYVNQPCVVTGRHQNPWIECDLASMRLDRIPLLRRQSGGGTVYHDTGNLNWCFMSLKDDYDPDRNFELIVHALREAGIPAGLSARKDVMVEGRKVSGSAYKVGKDRCFHHGTLLIDADLEKLTAYLQAPPRSLVSKGIDSVRSRVCNLSEYLPGLTIDDAVQLIGETYSGQSGIRNMDADDLDEAGREYSSMLRDWNWLFGKTPDFVHRIACTVKNTEAVLEIDVHRGRIRDLHLDAKALIGEHDKFNASVFEGCRYDSHDLMEAAAGMSDVSIELRSELRAVIEKEVECLKNLSEY